VRLIIANGPHKGHVYELATDTPTLIGRHSRTICIDDDDRVSRKHAAIAFKRDRWIIKDLHSSNGTFVNGQKVHAISLREGDRIQVGRTVMLFTLKQVRRGGRATLPSAMDRTLLLRPPTPGPGADDSHHDHDDDKPLPIAADESSSDHVLSGLSQEADEPAPEPLPEEQAQELADEPVASDDDEPASDDDDAPLKMPMHEPEPVAQDRGPRSAEDEALDVLLSDDDHDDDDEDDGEEDAQDDDEDDDIQVKKAGHAARGPVQRDVDADDQDDDDDDDDEIIDPEDENDRDDAELSLQGPDGDENADGADDLSLPVAMDLDDQADLPRRPPEESTPGHDESGETGHGHPTAAAATPPATQEPGKDPIDQLIALTREIEDTVDSVQTGAVRASPASPPTVTPESPQPPASSPSPRANLAPDPATTPAAPAMPRRVGTPPRPQASLEPGDPDDPAAAPEADDSSVEPALALLEAPAPGSAPAPAPGVATATGSGDALAAQTLAVASDAAHGSDAAADLGTDALEGPESPERSASLDRPESDGDAGVHFLFTADDHGQVDADATDASHDLHAAGESALHWQDATFSVDPPGDDAHDTAAGDADSNEHEQESDADTAALGDDHQSAVAAGLDTQAQDDLATHDPHEPQTLSDPHDAQPWSAPADDGPDLPQPLADEDADWQDEDDAALVDDPDDAQACTDGDADAGSQADADAEVDISLQAAAPVLPVVADDWSEVSGASDSPVAPAAPSVAGVIDGGAPADAPALDAQAPADSATPELSHDDGGDDNVDDGADDDADFIDDDDLTAGPDAPSADEEIVPLFDSSAAARARDASDVVSEDVDLPRESQPSPFAAILPHLREHGDERADSGLRDAFAQEIALQSKRQTLNDLPDDPDADLDDDVDDDADDKTVEEVSESAPPARDPVAAAEPARPPAVEPQPQTIILPMRQHRDGPTGVELALGVAVLLAIGLALWNLLAQQQTQRLLLQMSQPSPAASPIQPSLPPPPDDSSLVETPPVTPQGPSAPPQAAKVEKPDLFPEQVANVLAAVNAKIDDEGKPATPPSPDATASTSDTKDSGAAADSPAGNSGTSGGSGGATQASKSTLLEQMQTHIEKR
jgi:hypothetical protein